MPSRIPIPTPIAASSFPPSPFTHCQFCLRRTFSSSPRQQEVASRADRLAAARKKYWEWLNGPGRNFRQPVPNSTNYLTSYDLRSGRRLNANKSGPPNQRPGGGGSEGPKSDAAKALEEAAYDDSKKQNAGKNPLQPFPLNPQFVSQSVLSEELRNEVWKRVQVDKKSVREVSVELGIEMRRVGAVVRLVEVEKKMRSEGQTLALPYAQAIHAMLPKTPLTTPPTPHEGINDLPVHPLTKQQLFHPTSESRAFNRTDAGRVFSAAPRLPDSQDIGQGGTPLRQPWEDSEKEWIGRPAPPQGHKDFKKKGNMAVMQGEQMVLKPADARIPHPHLVAHEMDKLDPQLRNNKSQLQARYRQRLKDEEERIEKSLRNQKAREEETKTRIASDRWEWVVQDVQSDRLGQGVVGERYGVPAQDRKRGLIKIPMKVEV